MPIARGTKADVALDLFDESAKFVLLRIVTEPAGEADGATVSSAGKAAVHVGSGDDGRKHPVRGHKTPV